MVPRLFHSGDNLQPAVFIASETHVIPRETLATPDDAPAATTWVVHLWQPADARGQVAVSYGEHHTSQSEQLAAELLSRLPHVSAVAVVTDAECHFAHADAVEYSFQPEIAVAEPHVGTYRRGWFALAALLRVDLPWWPAGLRRIDDMAAWRPGARPQAIPPFIPGRYDSFMLRNLIKESAPPQSTRCEVLVDSLNRRIEGEIYRPSAKVSDVPGHVERPGVKQAARAYFSITDTPEPLKAFEMQALLRLSGATHATRSAAVRLLRGRPEMEPAVSYTIRAHVTDGPLAAEWISLQPCDDPQSLGSAFAEMMMSDVQRAEPRTWWVDPEDTNCWIVETLDGMPASRCC